MGVLEILMKKYVNSFLQKKKIFITYFKNEFSCK